MNPIYYGTARKKPGEEDINICINDVCADWLVKTFPSLVEGFTSSELPVEFVVLATNSEGIYHEVARVRFINDWSYDADRDPETQGLAAPINGRCDPRQWILWTGLEVSEVQAEIFPSSGEPFYVTIPVEIDADFDVDFNSDFANATRAAGSGTAIFSPTKWGDTTKIIINGNQYDIVSSCSKYVLYYLNAYGGWDSLLIEGASSEDDKLTRHTMTKSRLCDREKVNYLNEIQKNITLHTSWLSDEQSLRMHHLLNSTDVYLHDLVNNRILPVVLDSTSIPYKTFKGEGGKLVNYTIEVIIAQTRMRR